MKIYPSESEFIKYLEDQNKSWIFQPKEFKLKNTTYRTDFYCPEDDVYYEVVGTRQAISANKLKILEFIKSYPEIKLKIVKPNGENYYKNGINKLKKIKSFISSHKNPCRKCIEGCKQNKYSEVICCPQYIPSR